MARLASSMHLDGRCCDRPRNQPLVFVEPSLAPVEELGSLGVTSARQRNGDLKRWVDDTLAPWIGIGGSITRSVSRLPM